VRIAFFSTPFQGHLQPAHLLADELSARGHKTYLVCHPETEGTPGQWERLLLSPNHCDWTPQQFLRHAKRPGFPFGLRNIVSDMAKMTNSFCQAGPALLEAAGVDAIVSDQMEPAGALIADFLNIPYVSLARSSNQSRAARAAFFASLDLRK
jgi:zeaxanthin glucosyltransferase